MSVMNSVNMAVWLGLLLYILYKTSKHLWQEHAKLLVTHAVFMSFLIILHDGTFRTLGWAVRNFFNIKTYFYVQSGIYPPWLTLMTWVLGLVAGVLAIILALQVAARKDKYRLVLLRAIPFLLVCDFLRYYNQINKNVNIESKKIYTNIFISVLAVGVPYVVMFFFYSKEYVLSILFEGRFKAGSKEYKYAKKTSKGFKQRKQIR